ncbi:MAG TPA: hypothetical protein PKV31_04545, partial [Saprospiraceae bacterium]|nr:hypothetical protein [Saprospiraceae bacterium]
RFQKIVKNKFIEILQNIINKARNELSTLDSTLLNIYILHSKHPPYQSSPGPISPAFYQPATPC